jgi:hypothetical protein
MPFHRAKEKHAQIERELRKCPDFQLYLITKSANDRARMERVLMLDPNFRLWRALTSSIEQAHGHSAIAGTAGRNRTYLHQSRERDEHNDNEETAAPA